MKILIVDDQIEIRDLIKNLLINFLNIRFEIIESENISNTRELLNNDSFDLILLDIELGSENIFDLLDELPTLNSKIIFITHLNTEAIKAFKYSAVDYILKPIKPSDFIKSIERVILSQKMRLNSFDSLKNNLLHSNKKLLIQGSTIAEVISINDIIRIQADENYSVIFTSEEKFSSTKTLKYYEDLLKEEDEFFRIHRAHIININHLVRIDKEQYTITLKNGEILPLSQSRKKDLLIKLL